MPRSTGVSFTKNFRDVSEVFVSAEVLLRGDHVRDFDVLDLSSVVRHATRGVLDRAVRHCEQRIIFRHSDVQSRADFGSALTHEDVSCFCALSSVKFDAKTLSLRVSYIGCRAASFFMGHSGFVA